MSQTISNRRIEQVLEEMKEVSKLDYLLFDTEGELVAGTFADTTYGTSAKMFAMSLAETQVVQGWVFYRIEIQGNTEYVLLCGKSNDPDTVYVIGRMAVCQLRNMFMTSREPEDKAVVLRQILNGEIVESKLAEVTHQLQLKADKCMVYVIQYKKDEDHIIAETLRNLFVNTYMDYVIEMDGTRTVLMKDVSDIPNDNYEQYARMIVDNILAEAMISVWVGYGDVVKSMDALAKAYQNGCSALKIGVVFQGAERVFQFNQLGLGRLIHTLPEELCELFLKEVLGDNVNLDFDEETLTTINQLFDNNLNISETARQLYIHRNTLVYRLERIEKRLGLDIRSFEDAMLFKIAMMVKVHLSELKRESLQ